MSNKCGKVDTKGMQYGYSGRLRSNHVSIFIICGTVCLIH